MRRTTGYKFTSNSELRRAVLEWCQDATRATPTYGMLNTWDVSEITDMNNLFQNPQCKNTFTGVGIEDISNWDVSSVTNMFNLFYGTNRFVGDPSSWDVSSVTNMNGIFEQSKYEGLGLDNWDTSSVTTMKWVAYQNKFFKGTGIGNWDVSNVENFRSAFFMAPSFNADLSRWDVSKATDMKNMFGGIATWSTSGFSSDLSGWRPPAGANLQSFLNYARCFRGPMWPGHSVDMSTAGTRTSGCPEPVLLPAAPISLPTPRPTADPTAPQPTADPTAEPSADPTAEPTRAPVIPGYKFTSNNELRRAVIEWCGGNRATNAIPVYGMLNTWDVSEITDMNNLFQNPQCKNTFTGVGIEDISNWDVSSVTNMFNLFYGTNRFVGDLSSWDVSSVTNMNGIFEQSKYEGLGLDNWDTSSVTTMKWVAYQNKFFKGTGIGNWDVSNVENFRSAFFM